MIKILPAPPKGSKKASNSKTAENDKAASSDPINTATESFTVKASAKSIPKPPMSASKKPGQPASVPPPKQKVSTRGTPTVQVAAAVPEETDSKTSNSDKYRLAPPKKKNHGPAKAHLAADAQLTAEDAYDYEM